MAKQIEDIVLRLKQEGFENLDKIRGSFRELNKVTGFTETELQRLRKEVLSFDTGVGKNAQSLLGQVNALKALQAQAVAGSTVYRQLGKDVRDLGGAYKEAATGVKTFTDAQLKSQIIGSKPKTFDPQIAALKRGLQELNVYSRQYTDALTEIQRRQLPFNAALGRQGVIAGFEAYRQGGKGGGQLPSLPDTTAGLNQRLIELRDNLANVTRGGTDWIRVSREIAQVQRQLNQEFANPAIEVARRRLEASRGVSSGFSAFSSDVEDRLAVERSIARNQRRREAEAARRSGAMQGPAEPTELFRNVAAIGTANVSQLMGRNYTDVAESIRSVTRASDGSLNSLRAQRTAWESLRSSLGDNKKALREVDAELNNIDKQIAKRSRGGGRLSGMQFAQAAGAAITGGIYGGPEGFLGGVIGGVAGRGVGGAFAGAAIGAQVGMFRQQLGGAATYAADIGKLQIALRGIVGSQDAYNRALAAAASVTKDLNVPQETAIQGLTRLSAAVLGAGGNVNDSAFAFRAMSEAIKATGGGAEQVDGALLALTQVFSKGKVSAEELNQIAERLPGTFTLFAKATGRTGPELTKALEQGKVGLNDLMRFLGSIRGRYGQTALQIAASTEEAGARLTIAMKAMQLEVGKALLPVGAGFQTAFADFITNYSPAVIGAAKGIAGALKFIIVDPTVAEFAKLSLTIGVAVGSLAALQAAFAALPAVAAAASGAIGSLNAVLFANPWVALAAGIGAATYALITYKNKATEAAEAQKKLTDSVASKVALGGRFEMAARQRLDSLGQERSLIAAERDFYKLKGKDALSYDRRIKAKEAEMQVLRDSLQRQDASTAAAAAYDKFANPTGKASGSDKFKLSSQGQALVNASRALGVSPLDLATIIGFETQGTYSPNIMGGAGGKYMGLIQFGPNERKQYGAYAGQSFEEQVQGPVVKYLQDRFKNVGMSTQGANLLTLYRTVLGGNPKASLTREDEFGTSPTSGVARMGQHRAAALRRFFGGSLENVGYAGVEAAKDVLQGREEQQKFAQQSLEQLNAARERLFLRKDELRIAMALDPLAKAQAEFEKMRADRMRDTSAALANAKSDEERSLIVQEQLARIAIDEVTHRARLKEITDQQLQQEQERADLLKQSLDYMRELSTRGSADAGFRQGMESWGQSVGNLRDSVAQLTVDGMKGLEDSIVQLTTTGTVNFQQFAASILADTSRMIVRQFVLKGIMELLGFLKPSGIAGSFEMPSAGFMPTGGYKFAKGGMFDVANSIQPFAMGGVVRRPTLFAYANGGVPGMGLMGEAGPEAVMPLRRLPSGRLGVESAGGGSTNVTVNVDASGSQVQGDAGRGEALGRAVSAAVQQELIKQKRPGGLLS